MNPDAKPLDLLKQARAHNLLKLWASGRRQLTPAEVAEIRVLHPDFEPGAARPEPPPPIEPEVTGEQISLWAQTYGTQRRQLYRYLGIGRLKGDPCPLADAAQMPAWWSRNMKHRVPEKILLAAHAAKEAAPSTATAPPPAAENGAALPPLAGSFDLNAARYAEGEAVRQARQIVGANYSKLTAAYAADPIDLDGIQLWQVRWEKSVEALRKQERDDRDAMKARAQLLPRGQAEAEIAQMLEALRLMREAMPAKILAQLSIHARGRTRRILQLLEPALRVAIEHVRTRESDLLLNLQTLTSAEAAAAAISADTFTLVC